jgi:hypothetical protein
MNAWAMAELDLMEWAQKQQWLLAKISKWDYDSAKNIQVTLRTYVAPAGNIVNFKFYDGNLVDVFEGRRAEA